MSAKNLSVAEVLTRATDRVDSGLYFDPGQASANVGVPRIFVPRYRLLFMDHFLGDLIKDEWNNATQGTPTALSIRDEKNGVLRIGLEATSEAEENSLTFADKLQFDTTSGLVMEFGFRFPTAITTNQSAVLGFGSARNNTYDSVARNSWFKVAAAMDLLTESDDATTDTDDDDTAQDLTANVWHYGRIEFVSPNDVRFYAGASTPIRVNSDVTFKTGSTLVQPYFSVFKASGATQPVLDLDYVGIYART